MQETHNTVEESGSYDPREVRRTFRLLSLDVMSYICGLAFIDSSTIAPAFLATLTKSSIVIGLIIAIRSAGLFLPQLWTAHYIKDRKHHKSFLMKDALVSRVAVTLFAIILFVAGPGDRLLMLIAFIGMYTAFWFSEGIAGVPWTDLVAKAIPERLRGRLFGLTQFGGGIMALVAARFISRMLSPSGPGYPRGYAILMSVAAVLFWISFFNLLAVREPEGEAEEHDGGFMCYVRNIGKMLAGHAQLKQMLVIQLLIGFFGMSLPFYVLYARQVSHISLAVVGALLSVQIAGGIIFSAVAGYVNDHWGPRWAIVASLVSGFAASVLILFTHGSIWMYRAVFFAVGGFTGSTWIGLTNYLLESADPSERKSSIGLMNTANAPTIIFPILGGLIVQEVGYTTAFITTAVALFIALITALRLAPKRA